MLYLSASLRSSLPTYQGALTLSALKHSVQVRLDNHGIPTISTASELDAYTALGFLTARERMFQMDLMRRKSAGRLAEIFGDAALGFDRQQRNLQFERAVQAIARQLPADHLNALQAYVAGINAALEQMPTLPFEFLVLGYQPSPWRVEDSLLVALSMFQTLTLDQESERMLSVMEQALPKQVTAFLTPDVDVYESVLTGGTQSWRPSQPIPVQALATILNSSTRTSITERKSRLQTSHDNLSTLVNSDDFAPGSNAWVVGGSKTSDGRAILANDMHLPLRVPNIWYRTTLNFAGNMVSGVTLPGLPLIIAGTNGHVAWGYTNAYVDLTDLVSLELNPDNPEQYKTPDGWERFTHLKETIKVKNTDSQTIDVRHTRWGPVTSRTLLGKPVALKWTALDPTAVDLGLIHLHQAKTLEQAITVMNNAGGPPQNAMLADQSGRIAWTLMGKIPKRKGFDGAVSRSWTTKAIGWDGYLDAEQLPRVIDPESGFLVTANNRTIGKDYPFKLGHDYQMSFRAWRINQRLKAMQSISESDMLELQLDTKSDFYRYYQTLARSVLTPASIAEKPSRLMLLDTINSWDGKAETDSTGLPLLYEFRKALAREILPAYYQPCLQVQNDFRFTWSKKETPIRQLLDARIPDTLPKQQYADWDSMILDILEKTAEKMVASHKIDNLSELTWGEINTAEIHHPFSAKLPILSRFIDMPKTPLAGCPYCVRVVYGLFGASERMVVSPGHPGQAILHMPAGQSGHPLSPYYSDQHPYWEQGKALPFMSNNAARTFELIPGVPGND